MNTYRIRLNGEYLFDNATSQDYVVGAMYTALLVSGRIASFPYEFGYTYPEIHRIEIEKQDEKGNVVFTRVVYLADDE